MALQPCIADDSKLFWRRKSTRTGAQPRIAADTIGLIETMARNNRLWGAERIRGELRKLGIHVGVTRSPSSARVTQQLRAATAWGKGPRFLIRDNDDKFGRRFDAVAEGTGIRISRTPVRAPNANAVCERFLRSVRAERLDHVVILGEDHL
jgi:transposase InsO family protein